MNQGRQPRHVFRVDCVADSRQLFESRCYSKAKTLKSHAALAKSPTRTVRTQSNHCFLAIYAACRLTWLSVTHGLNHVALRTRLYLKAVRHAFDELQLLKAA